MKRSSPSLLEFMESWEGEKVWLQAHGGKIHLQWDDGNQKNNFNRLISQGIGVFGNLAHAYSRKKCNEPI